MNPGEQVHSYPWATTVHVPPFWHGVGSQVEWAEIKTHQIYFYCNYWLTIGSYISVRSSRYEARGKFGEHERCVRVAWGVAESNSYTLASWVLSKLPKCFISRWTHRLRMNQLFYNIFNQMEFFFLEGFACWRHERAQWEYEERSRNWIWLDKFTSYVII